MTSLIYTDHREHPNVCGGGTTSVHKCSAKVTFLDHLNVQPPAQGNVCDQALLRQQTPQQVHLLALNASGSRRVTCPVGQVVRQRFRRLRPQDTNGFQRTRTARSRSRSRRGLPAPGSQVRQCRHAPETARPPCGGPVISSGHPFCSSGRSRPGRSHSGGAHRCLRRSHSGPGLSMSFTMSTNS